MPAKADLGAGAEKANFVRNSVIEPWCSEGRFVVFDALEFNGSRP